MFVLDFVEIDYLPEHPSITVVIDHCVVKIEHHQILHFSPEETDETCTACPG